MSRSYSVVVVAGGSGQRVGADRPKQYLEVLGKPILCWTVERLLKATEDLSIAEVVLVVPKDDEAFVEKLLKEAQIPLEQIRLVTGGNSRAESVWAGLEKCSGEFVFVHDGVRPMVTKSLVDKLVQCSEYQHFNGVVPAVTPVEAVRMERYDPISGDGNCSVSRDEVYLVQTPQLFRRYMLCEAYGSYFVVEDREGVHDDATIFEEFLDEKIGICEGIRSNIKVTYAHDLKLLAYLLEEEAEC